MASELEGVRALCFDVGGTVFDWYSGISTAVAEVAQRKGASLDAAAFAVQWRGLFFETLAKVRSGELPHHERGRHSPPDAGRGLVKLPGAGAERRRQDGADGRVAPPAGLV